MLQFYETKNTIKGIVISDINELIKIICEARFASLPRLAENIAT